MLVQRRCAIVNCTLAIRAKIRRCARILNFDTPAGWLIALAGIAFYF